MTKPFFRRKHATDYFEKGRAYAIFSSAVVATMTNADKAMN